MLSGWCERGFRRRLPAGDLPPRVPAPDTVPHRYRFLPREPLALAVLEGPFELDPSLRLLGEMWEDSRRTDEHGLIWDVRRRTSAPDAHQLRILVGEFTRWRRVAIVTKPLVQYGMARMAAGLSDQVVEGFRDPREALEWIRGR